MKSERPCSRYIVDSRSHPLNQTVDTQRSSPSFVDTQTLEQRVRELEAVVAALSQKLETETVVARSVMVRDQEGAPRGSMAVSDDGCPEISLLQPNGDIRVQVALGHRGEPRLTLFDQEGRQRSATQLDEAGSPSIYLWDSSGLNLVALRVADNGECEVTLNAGLAGKLRLSATPEGRFVVAMHSETGSETLVLRTGGDTCGDLAIRGANGDPRVRLSLAKNDEVGLTLWDYVGQRRLQVVADEFGDPAVTLFDEDGERIDGDPTKGVDSAQDTDAPLISAGSRDVRSPRGDGTISGSFAPPIIETRDRSDTRVKELTNSLNEDEEELDDEDVDDELEDEDEDDDDDDDAGELEEVDGEGNAANLVDLEQLPDGEEDNEIDEEDALAHIGRKRSTVGGQFWRPPSEAGPQVIRVVRYPSKEQIAQWASELGMSHVDILTPVGICAEDADLRIALLGYVHTPRSLPDAGVALLLELENPNRAEVSLVDLAGRALLIDDAGEQYSVLNGHVALNGKAHPDRGYVTIPSLASYVCYLVFPHPAPEWRRFVGLRLRDQFLARGEFGDHSFELAIR